MASWSYPAIGGDGTIYYGAGVNMYAFTDTGTSYTQKWAFQTGAGIGSTPSIAADGTLYFGSNDGKLYAIAGPPTISAFTPSSGGAGTVVTLTGSNFTGASAVAFGGTAATAFTVVNATTIMATVGAGATGAITVTTPNGMVSSTGVFTFAVAIAKVTLAATRPPRSPPAPR